MNDSISSDKFCFFFLSWQPTYQNSFFFFFPFRPTLCFIREPCIKLLKFAIFSKIFHIFSISFLSIGHLWEKCTSSWWGCLHQVIKEFTSREMVMLLSHFNKDDYMNIQLFWLAAFWKTIKYHFRIFKSFLVAAKPDKLVFNWLYLF